MPVLALPQKIGEQASSRPTLVAPQAKGAPRFGQAKSVSAGQPLQWAKAQASRQGADKTIIYTENKQHKQIFMPKSLTITA